MHLLADPRLVRRVVKRQQGLSGFGLQVPHPLCCVVERAALLRIVSEGELGKKAADLPATVILVARPEREDLRAVWRRAFHAHVHQHLDERVRAGHLTEALVRARIHRIGQTEFDEIRAVLRAEELLFVAGDDRATYIEFAAFYLELVHFDPDSLDEFFPTIRDAAPALAALAEDVDAKALLAASKPEGAPALPARPIAKGQSSIPPAYADVAPAAPSGARDEAARTAKKKGNVVRSLLVRMRAGESAEDDIESFARRLHAALPEPPASSTPAPSIDEWRSVIRPLAQAAAHSKSPRALEARVLHDMQKACVDAERRRNAVDVVTWLTSAFRRPIVRPLPAVGVVRIARHLKHAFEKSHRARLAKWDRAELVKVFRAALALANGNVQRTLEPELEAVLDEVGLGPRSVPERVAREKLSKEIVDLVLERGSLGISHLRDALSRSNLKLPNVTPAALVAGDPLLKADALLAKRLDGVYRRGEIYLRMLQKVSSIAFGTRSGRLFTLHLALPVLLSFVLLEGVQHLAHPIAKALHHRHFHLLTPASFTALAILFYGLIHSGAVQQACRGALRAAGVVLYLIFLAVPKLILASAPVRALIRSRIFSLVTKPAVLGGVVFLVARRAGMEHTHALASSGVLVLTTALFLATPLGFRIEEALTDMVVRRVRELARRALPGVIAFLIDIFRAFVERVERGIYTVDEWLTFKDGQSRAALVSKGALGIVWFFATYLLRIYVNLLIEPQVNPIKHFPVVTVSHKIILPLSPTILETLRDQLSPLGMVASNTIAGSTVFLLPGVFGFLVWELKENWKLYDQNRSKTLEPVRIGHHGETMNALLVTGFHSGTIPKLYAKLRSATKAGSAKMNAYRQDIHEVEHAIETFVDRELAGLLREAKRWQAGELAVRSVEVGSNRIRVSVACSSVAPETACILFEEQSGLLVASVGEAGFIRALDADHRATFELALAGLYKRAGVDIVREQVEALLPKGTPYDVADEGLIVWPGEGYETEVVYPLDQAGFISGTVRGTPLSSPPPSLVTEQLLFSKQTIDWAAWVDAFREDTDTSTTTRAPLVAGPPLLALAG